MAQKGEDFYRVEQAANIVVDKLGENWGIRKLVEWNGEEEEVRRNAAASVVREDDAGMTSEGLKVKSFPFFLLDKLCIL